LFKTKTKRTAKHPDGILNPNQDKAASPLGFSDLRKQRAIITAAIQLKEKT
jgi:hypothetical protein